jgi:hypothetical protein
MSIISGLIPNLSGISPVFRKKRKNIETKAILARLM